MVKGRSSPSACISSDEHAGVSGFPRTTEYDAVVIVVIDLGFGDVDNNGCKIATLNFDPIARADMTLVRNSVYPICSPTKAGLLTGQNLRR